MVESRRERRRRKRLEEQDATIPAEMYGLRQGTVTLLTGLAFLFAIFTLIPIAWIAINGVARLDPGASVRAGTQVTFAVDAARMHFFDPDTGHAVG